MPTASELAFLEAQCIPESMVFHADGLPKRVYRPLMKQLDAIIVTGTRPCAAGGHTIRTRAGHCVQCDTAKIAFQQRHSTPAFVYVAASRTLNLHKIGSSRDANKRLTALNAYGYGGANDWSLIDQEFSPNAGQAEFAIHAVLDHYRQPVRYRREGAWVECREIFNAPAAVILRTLRAETQRHNSKPLHP